MKKTQMMTSLFLLGAAAAASAADNGFYFGATGGQATYEFEPLPIATALLPVPTIVPSFNPYTANVAASLRVPAVGGEVGGVRAFAGPSEAFWIPSRDDETTTWSVLAGYRFFRYAAVELAYQDLGTLHDYSPSRVLGPITTIEVKSEMESAGATLSFLGQLPITDAWSVYLRAGGLFVDQEISRRIGSTKLEDSHDSEVFLYGIGTQLDLGAHWSVRVDFQRFDDVGKGLRSGEADVDSLTLGVLFRLGGK